MSSQVSGFGFQEVGMKPRSRGSGMKLAMSRNSSCIKIHGIGRVTGLIYRLLLMSRCLFGTPAVVNTAIHTIHAAGCGYSTLDDNVILSTAEKLYSYGCFVPSRCLWTRALAPGHQLAQGTHVYSWASVPRHQLAHGTHVHSSLSWASMKRQ